ncbi:MAG: glucose-6-phosphate isomerase [Oscillospiraceae bacterium]|nr:glucose-6-phosphate isomerase [Oscillospiraceae bacterium]
MIKVDISNIWGELSLRDLLSIESELSAAHMTVSERSGAGSEYLGWMELPDRAPTAEHMRILAAAHQIRQTSDVLVVVGIGGSYLGARAVIELLQGKNRNLRRGKGDPQIFFAGNSLSTRAWNELMRLLEGKDFSVCVISKSGTTLESAIAFRNLKWMLERRYGTAQAKRRIYAVTDKTKGALRQMADEEGWESFVIPGDVGGRFSVLTPVGLLPMAVAGIDIVAVLRGAAKAKKEYDLRSFENPVWLYAAVRNLMLRQGKAIELLCAFEPDFSVMGSWWQQLFGESEGKDGKGLFPACAAFTADLHSLGQLVQDGQRNLFETMLRFDPPKLRCTVVSDLKDLDGLNYLAGKTLDHVQEQAYLGTMAAHADGGCPVIAIDCGPVTDESVGELIWFFELSCAVSAYLLGVNPFDQPGVEAYKKNMLQLLGKPGM